MSPSLRNIRRLLALALMALALAACMPSKNLRTFIIDQDPPDGRCRLILYTSYDGEVELRVAVLDLKGDAYDITPFAPKHSFNIQEDLGVYEALDSARAFVKRLFGVERMEVRKVLDMEGRVIAYEARPIYAPLQHGPLDITETSYFLENGNQVKYVVRSAQGHNKLLLFDNKFKN